MKLLYCYYPPHPPHTHTHTHSLLKVLRCAGNEDSITLRAKDDTDSMEVFIENTDQDRTSTFEIKLMDLNQERLEIPVSHVMSCDTCILVTLR